MEPLRRSYWQPRIAAAVADSRWAPVFTESLICRGVVRAAVIVGRSLDGRSSWIGQTLGRSAPPTAFPLMRRVAGDSLMWRTIEGVSLAFGASPWSDSRLAVGWRAVEAADRRTRFRLAAWIAIVASIIRIVVGFDSLKTSMLALAFWSIVLALSALVFAALSRRQPRL